AILMWYTNVHLGGSLTNLVTFVQSQGVLGAFSRIWAPVFFGSKVAWTIIAIFAVFQLLLMRFVPGKRFEGPITPKGNIPIYKANGVACFLLTLSTFSLCSFGLNLFPASILYDHFGEILGAWNVFSLLFCLFLYFKGRFKPSSTDASVSGNFLFDFYWGTELYPRIKSWDLKMFTNCRFGMMSWTILLLSFAAKQSELYGLSDGMVVALLLQFFYVGKFFLWETGYLRSMDIMHDRAGFYICWGCLVWVPSVYTSPTLYLVQHPIHLGTTVTSLLLIVGASAILINYLADRQRQKVRATQGVCTVWGKQPLLTKASYSTSSGEVKENILLASGWWGVARHFHYLPEILGALCWSLPALFSNFLPYFYVLFLTALLIDRSVRDDKRCKEKYGSNWDLHCQKVRYKILPYVW
ncbi:MAG: 7-dehydrocholesterol reductase, partial [Chlamydiae bacterium]|nr:7-dehydrocholesterol reductase [Chlamydiota bacterium]